MSAEVNRRILFIDDEELILFGLREYFTTLGFVVDSAMDYQEARGKIVPGRYRIVVADLRLSGSEGTEGLSIAAHVRDAAPGTGVILLSAFGSTEVEKEAARLGVDFFLHKPLALGELARFVAQVIRCRPELTR